MASVSPEDAYTAPPEASVTVKPVPSALTVMPDAAVDCAGEKAVPFMPPKAKPPLFSSVTDESAEEP